MKLWNLAKSCAECRVCDGAALQTPPVLFAGNPDAQILALGQNPGWIKDIDEHRAVWKDDIFPMLPEDVKNSIMPAWYQWDFMTSPGYTRLSRVFGKGWLTSGLFMWSNAVRCRTIENERPPKEMIEACAVWTEQLMEKRKATIMVGALAKNQVLGDDASRLDWGIPRKHPRLGLILAIKHYSAWRVKAETDTFKKAAAKLIERVSHGDKD